MLEVSFLIKQSEQLHKPSAVQLTEREATDALLSASGKQSIWSVQDDGDCRFISNGDEEARVAIMKRKPTLLIMMPLLNILELLLHCQSS